MNNKKNQKVVDFQKYLRKKMENPRFKKHYNGYGKQLEIAYQILQLRKQKKISQIELARKLGTKQSNIARIEAGQQNLTTDNLQKIASVFNRELKIEFVK
jgi:ribosome-binding protein aMBF1 (putative translation factor)